MSFPNCCVFAASFRIRLWKTFFSFSRISLKPQEILTEDIEQDYSRDSGLFLLSVCSIRTRSRNQDKLPWSNKIDRQLTQQRHHRSIRSNGRQIRRFVQNKWRLHIRRLFREWLYRLDFPLSKVRKRLGPVFRLRRHGVQLNLLID